MNEIKTFLVLTLSSLVAYLHPINDLLFAVGLAFTLNFLAGYLAGMIAKNESFSLKKAFWTIIEACVFVVVVAATYTIGDHMNNAEQTLYYVSYISYVTLYFYAVNIFRNLNLLLPETKWISFCYWVLSFEIIKSIPLLETFTKKDQSQD